MATDQMRDSWTDARLDDFSKHVDQRFDAVDQRFDAVDRRFDAVERRFEAVEQRMENGFGRIESHLVGLHKTMTQASAMIIVALIGLIATQL
jgi:tetrahydromethanopterin S-methyltransferase subunit G